MKNINLDLLLTCCLIISVITKLHGESAFPSSEFERKF